LFGGLAFWVFGVNRLVDMTNDAQPNGNRVADEERETQRSDSDAAAKRPANN